MFEKLKKSIISYVYVISNQPVKLYELLSANRLLNEGMHLDGAKLGFRLKTGRAYVVFLVLVNIFMIPITILSHGVFKHIDCHIALLLTAITTAIIFASFGLFKDWLSDEVAKIRIKRMWRLHFAYFDYDEYNKQINSIYLQSIEENIQKQDLERYILDKLAN